MRRHLLAVGLLLVAVFGGCASPTEEQEDVENAEGAASTREPGDVIFRAASFTVPAAHADKRAGEIFTSDDELRTFFGESCGWFCTKKYEGRLSFTIQDPPGKQGALVYVNKPEVPRGSELVIKSIERRGNPKWLHVDTCVRPIGGGTTRPYAFAMVEVNTTLPLIWVSAPEEGQGLEACR
jgi:hypothetical protein